MSGELFKKYYQRLAKEGILKSILCGLIIGFAFLAVFATLFWFMGWQGFWVGLILFGIISAVAGVLFYKWKFQPTTKAIARRVDELGLEERLITMAELEGDDSYIAMRQREDALQALNKVNASLIKIVVSLPIIISVAVSGVVGVGMTTVSALAGFGVIPSGLEMLTSSNEDQDLGWCKITYSVLETGGTITGELNQTVQQGGSATSVVAEAEDEWVFIAWSDGLQNPYRQDINVQYDMQIYAIFLPIEMVSDGESEAQRDGQPDPNQPQDPTQPPIPTFSPGRYEEVNKIIDGETFYGDVYSDA